MAKKAAKPSLPKPPTVPMPDLNKGACRNADPELFFDDAYDDADQPHPLVHVYCNIKCEIKDACLNWAMATSQRHGMWGGMTPRQRMKVNTPIVRVSCPGCFGTDILEQPTTETCLSCGLSWNI